MAIEQQVYQAPWTPATMKQSLSGQSFGYGVTTNNQIIGYGILSQVLDEAELLNLAISPHWQGQGVGRYLLDEILQHMPTIKAHRLFLEVRVSNQPAIALYQRAGFVDIGYRKGYYSTTSGSEDARVLAWTQNRESMPTC